MVNWKKSIRSGVVPEYLTPFPPVAGVSTTVAISIATHAPVVKIICHALLDGRSSYFPMHRAQQGQVFDRYEAHIHPPVQPCWKFSFQIETEQGWYFATRTGLQVYHPSEARMYSVDPSIEASSWVAGSTFYQIFPDRFRKGDPSIDIETHEYTFDGGTTRALNWDEEPLSYKEGRCLDFYNGDLKGIEEAIPHFKALGITALYLTPIFRAKTNHRYDCTDYFTVDEHLGGDEALIQLCKSLHKANIHVLLDVSINHTGIDHPWYKKALKDKNSTESEFYYRKGDGTFVFWQHVHTLPQLNYSNQALRDRMYRKSDSVVRKYLQEPYAIDGWRFDVGTDTGRHETDQFCHEIWQEVRVAIKKTNTDAYYIGEAWEDAAAYLQGDQWDSAMNYFGSGRLLRRWYGQQDTFLMANWGHSDESGRPLSGFALSEAIKQHLYAIPDQLVPLQFNLIDSHDTMRLHNHTRIFDWELYRGVVMLLYLLPGVPSVYYGDEVGLKGTIESNEGARYPMQWDETEWNQRFYDLYKRLGELRKTHAWAAYGDWQTEYIAHETVMFSRTYQGEGVFMVLNRGSTEQTIRVNVEHLGIKKIGEWESGQEPNWDNESLEIELGAKQSKMFLYTCYF